FFFFQAEDGIRDRTVTGVQTCALPIFPGDDRIRRPRAPVSVARRHHVRGRPYPESRADGGAGARHPIILHVREALLPQGRPVDRSEERRVGKEWRSRWGRESEDKTTKS